MFTIAIIFNSCKGSSGRALVGSFDVSMDNAICCLGCWLANTFYVILRAMEKLKFCIRKLSKDV